MWLMIELSRSGEGVRVSAQAERMEQSAPRMLGLDVAAVKRFAGAVRAAAMAEVPRSLDGDTLATARALLGAVMDGGVDGVRARLAEAGGPVLLRLDLPDAELQGVPWEALCKADEAMGFWASSPDLLPVRNVRSTDPWVPRSVRGAVRVLAIVPSSEVGLSNLKRALQGRIDAGEVEWLEPIAGARANVTGLFDRLRREPVPHVIHFIGHGAERDGTPMICLSDEEGAESWLAVELLAQQLKARFRSELRLVVLESCDGARPSQFASAAEILARAGADAVVAHLWPVRFDAARDCSAELYRALTAGSLVNGDIASSLNDARRLLLAKLGSAEAFSPVVYLRGPSGVLFDFGGRKTGAAAEKAGPKAAPVAPKGPLGRVLEKPCSLVLGDRFGELLPGLAGFRDRLQKELESASVPVPPTLPMATLAQRYALHMGTDPLRDEFQAAFPGAPPVPAFISALARAVGPGVHTTLLRTPWLEQAIAAAQPERTLHVLQLGGDRPLSMRRAPGGPWKRSQPPATFDPESEILLLRLYGGYTQTNNFAPPLLTEDEYSLGLEALEAALPYDVGAAVLAPLDKRPALLMGLSLHTSHHRSLLRRFFPRGVPAGSVAVLEPDTSERDLWQQGVGLPGKAEGMDVVEATGDEIGAALRGEKDL